ncbi:Alkaline phosphatase precursor [compost metagenome]
MTSRGLLVMMCCFLLFSANGMYLMPRAEAVQNESNVFLLPGVSAEANGTLSNEVPANAIDGMNNSKWAYDTIASPSANSPYWLMVDTGAEASVTRFEVKHAGAGGEPAAYNTRDYTIEISDDSVHWNTAVTVTGNVYDETVHELTTPVTARYFKLNITDSGDANPSNGHYAARIYEFEAFGVLGKAEAKAAVSGITLNKSKVLLMAGEQEQLTAEVTPEDAAEPDYVWSSDNSGIATVDADGLITAVGAGTANITAAVEDGSYKATAAVVVEEAKLIGKNSQWKYLDDGSNPGTDWRAADYSDNTWKSAAAPLGYAGSGKGLDLNTRIGYGPNSGSKYITTYFRKEFQVADADKLGKLAATLIRDDGAVIYLNGTEVFRSNMPDGAVSSGTLAASAVGDERNEVPFTIDPSLLVDGRNVIAAEVHQNAATSSDLFFSMELEGFDAPAKSQGLLAQYYTNKGPAGNYAYDVLKSTIIDPQINFSNLEPVFQERIGRTDEGSVRWTGQIVPAFTEDYTFYLMGDNGFKLWIEDMEQPIITFWENQWDLEQTSAPVHLEAGKKYAFKIEYFENNGGSNLYLRWSSPSVAKQIVPASAFFLPAEYAGPVSGTLLPAGDQAELQFAEELGNVPQDLAAHLTVTAGEEEQTIATVQGNASKLTLKLNKPIAPETAVNVRYDGSGGLQTLAGTAVGSFAFTLDNRSEAVDYSPISIAMSFNGSPKTNRGFAWYTPYELPEKAPENVKDSIVEVVPSGESFQSDKVVRYTGKPEETRVLNLKITNSENGSFISHKVLVDGLAPGTAYDYRVGSEGNWSAPGSFTTEADSEKDFEFLYMTDSQGANSHDYDVWADTLKNGLEDYPDSKFLMMTGDQVDAGALEYQWLDYFGKPQALLMNLPLMAAVGNHEGPYNDNYYYHFNYPNASIKDPLPPGSVYSYDYGDAHFMVINTMDMGWDERQKESFKQQIEWLRREVAQTDKKWKVVAFHKAIYSVGGHSVDSDILALRQTLYPVFDELGIDVVLQGHDHTFMRSYQMYGDKAVADIDKDANGNPLNPDGTMYIVNNSAGTKYYDVNNNLDKYYAAVFEQPRVPVYSGIKFTENSFTVESYRSGEANPFDTYTIVRNDSAPKPVEALAAGRTGNGKTVLTWTKPEDSSSGDAIRGFRIYEKNGKLGMNWSAFVPVQQGRVNYEYLVEGADSSQAYDFEVKAVDKRDNSAASTVSTGDGRPAAPTAAVVNDGFNTFGWTNVSGYTDPADYEYSTDGGKTWLPVTANPQPLEDADYPAGMVMVRVKEDEAAGIPAGAPLVSNQAFTVNSIHNTYSVTGSVYRDSQMKVEVNVEQHSDYSGEAYVVFELFDGDTPLLINAIPIQQSKLNISQYFNVSGAGYRVKVFVFDAFNSDPEVPLHLAQPIELQ